MRRATIAIAFFLSCSGQVLAQENPFWELEEVVVSDSRLTDYSEGHKLTRLKDSILERSGIFLTSLLAFNSNIYFKENGFGMVSSPSFRGTNASHTAVVWNGININSPLNGQVDFNTINPRGYSSVDVRSGGGSLQFGTGAIGGSVHLNNDLRFEKHFENRALLGYGDFDTKKVNYDHSYGTGKWSHSFGINYVESENDYKFLASDERNENGEFENLGLNFNAGYLLSDQNVLRLYHQSFIGDRHLSGNLVAPGRSRYVDNQFRTQMEWVQLRKKSTSKLKLAHLFENFKYFENRDSDIFSEGQVTTLLARYSYDAKLSETFRVNSFAEYDRYRGGGSAFGNPERNDVAISALLKHRLTESLTYNVGVRKDFSSDFSSPFVYSLDGNYRVGEHYGLQLSASRNFRIPTFNDLYWNPGGNLDLVPESSYQIDLGQKFGYGATNIRLNTYYIATDDMIRWLPDASGVWSPINVDKVQIYGLEAELATTFPILQNQKLELRANYAYTVSEDRATGEQSIYVPLHKANASVAYQFSRFGWFYQHLYNGPVSIIADVLKGYQVANTGITFAPKLEGKLQYQLGVTLNNIFNTYYENVALRPMPNRNIQTLLILNF